MIRQKYLTNKDLLHEIWRSKNTFSAFSADEYAQYDIILANLEKVNRLTLAQAKRNRADRIGKQAYEEAKAYDDAYEAYELIFNDYSDSKYAQNIELRMARAKAKITAQ